ncbi:MAG: DUF1573 domain-containing protein [Planctomycetota bacterium]
MTQFSPITGRRGFAIAVCGTLLALPAAPVLGQTVDATNWAAKMFDETEHDFRIVGRGTKCEYHFTFANLFQEDVHVASVRSSCGCTTPTVTKDTLKTHEKSAVVAKFNTSTFIGKKAATITVVFDKPYYAEVQLKVGGFIRTDVTFDPPEIAFGEIAPGSETQQDVLITYTGSKDWQITDVRSHCSDLQVQLSPATKTPGKVQYRMRVKVLGSMSEGDVRERLTLISNDRDFPTTEMSINGRVRPSLSVSPAALSLGTAEPSSIIEKRVLVRGDEPFRISDVVCSDDRFEFVIPDEAKKIHFVTIRFKAGAGADRIAQEIRFETDLKGGKAVNCVVTGSLGRQTVR